MNKIPIAKPFIDQNDEEAVVKVLRSGHLSLGPYYKQFESNMSAYVGTKYASAVSSGTAGLHICVKSLGINEGDEVITSPFSFIASANCLLYEKAKPIFIDIDQTTYNFDATRIEQAITEKTKAILVVHIFGQSADMDKVLEIAKKYNLRVIEDSCESLGSEYKGHKTGTMGDAGVFAFYPNKQMTTGEGGIIVTNSEEVYRLSNSLRNQGRSEGNDWLAHERLGYNYRMDEMSAALGVTQLSKLDWMIEQKAQIASWYNEYLTDTPSIITPKTDPNGTHSWFVYVVRITSGKRNKVMENLLAEGIQTKAYLPVIHLQPFMRKMFNFKEGDLPIAEEISSQTLALPFYIGLKKEEVAYVCQQLLKHL